MIQTGVVEAKSNKFDKWSILVDGNWYSSKYEIKAERGDVVEFDDGDKKYCSKLKIVGKGEATSSGSAKAAPKASYSRGEFPVPLLDGSRAIIRQNAVTNANAFFGNNATTYTSDQLIAMAREIEAYTTGDVERVNVEKTMKAGFNPED